MGYTLQSLIRKDVVTIGKYETLGYGRFQLSDIQVNSGNVLLEMDQLEAPSPLNWAYRAAVHRTRAPRNACLQKWVTISQVTELAKKQSS